MTAKETADRSADEQEREKFNLTSLTIEGYYAWVVKEMARLDDCEIQATLGHILRDWVGKNGEDLKGYGGLTREDYANRGKVTPHPSSKKPKG